jgi:hypothetical protein
MADKSVLHTGEYGANCHFHQLQRPTPVCIITDAQADSERIIASSLVETREGEPVWAIRSVTVNLTRIWSASSAVIYLTVKVPDLLAEPPVVPFELHPEQPIAIYMGYVEGPREVDEGDIAENRLIRVFVGVVDTVTGACTGKVGYSLKVQCRDRVKWFMDSALIFNLSQSDENFLKTHGTGVNRAQGIWFILNSAIGRDGSCELPGEGGTQAGNYCRTDCEGCGVTLKPGIIKKSAADGRGPAEFYGTKIKGRVENEPLTDPYAVTTNIYTTRPYLGDNTQTSFMLMDNSAIETIKRMSYMEVYRTEFFQDPHTGELFYIPTGIDTTGLDDPKRFMRTYYVRNVPAGMEVKDINQMVLSYREDASTINLRTNVVVGGFSAEGSGDYVVHFKGAPAQLRNIPHACRFAVYQDQAITSPTESMFIAIALSRETGRLLRSVEMTVIGDPSLSLGEALQVISSPLQLSEEQKRRDAEYYQQERESLKNKVQAAEAFFKETAADIGGNVDRSISDAAAAANGITYPTGDVIYNKLGSAGNDADITCRPDTWVNQKEGKNYYYKEDLPSMWRVDAITHHFKATGFVTQLLLGIPM